MSLSEQLRSNRRRLFDQMEKIDSPKSLLEFQLAIVEEIKKSERSANNDETGEHKWHIHLLRCYGDALAWELLHPHTIRNLAKNPSPPASLIDQKDGLKHTIESAHDFTDDGIPVLISDITNCLKISDLVLCNDPELPSLVECKGGNFVPELSMRGRSGRQQSRAISVLKYLYDGKGKLYGESGSSTIIDINVDVKHTWDSVNQTVSKAIRTGFGFDISDESDIVWAFIDDDRYDNPPFPTKELKNLAPKFKIPFIGCHLVPLDYANPRIPPPIVWPIYRDYKFALMEGDVVLMHLIDVEKFKKIVTKNGRVVEILRKRNVLDEYCFLVEIDGKRCRLSYCFLENVVYGYETIESSAKCIIETANKALTLKPLTTLPTSKPSRKPKLRVVRNFKDSMQLLKEAQTFSKEDIVSVQMSFFAKICRGIYEKAGNNPKVEKLLSHPIYIIKHK